MQKICIIIPCYNESKRLSRQEFVAFYEQNQDVSFCFVNDGSQDETRDLLYKIQRDRERRVMVIDSSINRGKAESVRNGILKALEWKKYDYIGFFDADFSTPLSEINHLMSYNQYHITHKIIFGSRVKRLGAVVERRPLRHYLGRIFSTVAGLMLKLPVYDTQCGAKLFSTDIVYKLFKQPFISKWLFDIEIFARTIDLVGIDNTKKIMMEIPLQRWVDKEDSKLSARYMLKVPFELMKIFLAYRKKKSV